MGKSSATSAPTDQELTKLQSLLHQSVHDTVIYLEALKHSLGDYDHKYQLHRLSGSAASFFEDGLDHAKDAVKELRHAADHMHKTAGEREVNAARHAMEQVFNALADLHKVANAFDSEHPTPNKHSDKKTTISDKLEWLVSTTRDASFTGFAPLQHQIIEVQAALGVIEKPASKPSITARAKEAVHRKLDQLHISSPKDKGGEQTEASAHSI